MSSFWEKYKARRRLGKRVTFWYHPRYEVPSLARLAKSLGIVALRGKLVLAELAQLGLLKPGDMRGFPLVSIKELEAFHGKAYLERVARPGTLAHIFGIPPEEVEVDEILSGVRWAVSGTCRATRAALRGPSRLAVNFGGGFHHAEPDMGSGFCVFNDVGVAIRGIRRDGFSGKIAIVDLDFHQGNGNTVGFLGDPSVAIYSLHGSIWTDSAKPNDYNRCLNGKTDDPVYLKALRESLPEFLDREAPRLAFYIAGNDVLQQDMLGEFQLSLAGVESRDRFVLDRLAEKDIPAVVTLAGGYSLLASQATLNLARIALGIDKAIEIESGGENAPPFRRLMASIDPSHPAYRNEPGLSLSEAELFPDWQPRLGTNGDQASAYAIEREMEMKGVLEKYRAKGWRDFRVSLDARDPERRKVVVLARSGSGKAPLTLVQ